MKKIYMILAAAALVGAAAACQKNETNAPETEPADQSITVNITVSNLTPDTKAIKTGWEIGDILNVYLDDTGDDPDSYVPDFTLTYDGTQWVSSDISSLASRLKATGGYLRGFWEGSNSCMSDPKWDNVSTVVCFPDYDKTTTTGVENYLVADFSNIEYTYDGSKLTANINLWRFRTNFQLVVTGLVYEAGRYTFYSEDIENSNLVEIKSGISPYECFAAYNAFGASEGRIAGIPNADGVAFVGGILSTSSTDYTFHIIDNTTGVDYTFSKTAALNHSSFTKVVAIKIPFNKFAVDMGLSVKWSAFNLGATSFFPTADTDEARQATWGDYYAWGELEPYYTPGHAYLITSPSDWKSGLEYSGYDWASYKFDTSGNGSALTKYKSGGTDFSFLQPEDDVVTTEMGGSWRIPRYGDWEQLRDPSNCTWEWDATNMGYKVTSLKTGYTSQYIFLPAAGSWVGNVALTHPGEDGCYWSSSLDTSSGEGKFARGLDFNASTRGASSVMRFLGNSIRPVHP